METPEQIRASMRAMIAADLAAWEAAEQTDSHRHISDVSWIVCTGNLALNVSGNVWTPVFIHPGFLGVSVMLRQDAERIAARRGDGYRAVPMRDFPALRVAELRATLAYLDSLSAPAPDAK